MRLVGVAELRGDLRSRRKAFRAGTPRTPHLFLHPAQHFGEQIVAVPEVRVQRADGTARLRGDVDLAMLTKAPQQMEAFVERIPLEAPEGEPLRLEFRSFLDAVRGEAPVATSTTSAGSSSTPPLASRASTRCGAPGRWSPENAAVPSRIRMPSRSSRALMSSSDSR